jgi:AraC family L-rhamnose operon transcriptional activator RhaR
MSENWLPPGRRGDLVAARLVRLLEPILERQASSQARMVSSESRGLLDRIRALVIDQPALSVVGAARVLGISESHLRDRFRRESGISLGRFLRETSLRSAAIKIRTQGMTVKEAAAAAGYSDEFSFSRAFSRLVGVPPSKLRGRR